MGTIRIICIHTVVVTRSPCQTAPSRLARSNSNETGGRDGPLRYRRTSHSNGLSHRPGDRRNPVGLSGPHRHRARAGTFWSIPPPARVADGVAFCRSIYGASPMGDVVDLGRRHVRRAPDVVASRSGNPADLPWEPGVAHCIADVFNPDGTPAEESPRTVLKRVVDQFAGLGMRPIVGPELEFYVLEPDASAPSGWRRYGDAPGNVYVAGRKGDPENVLCVPAHIGRVRVGRRRGQPRVLQRPVRDQPVAHGRTGSGRPGVPAQVRGQGTGAPGRQAGHVHGQAVQRRGRLRFPCPLQHDRR